MTSFSSRPISDDDIERLLTVARQQPTDSARDRLATLRNIAIVLPLRRTGARVMEISGLRRHDLRDDRSAIIIGKRHKERTIYFDTASWAAITAYLAARGAGPADPVFIRHDRNAAPPMPLSAAAGWRIVPRIIAASGLSDADITPHSFRHYVATKLYQATGDLGLTQTALGHSSPDTTRIYAQLDDAALRTAHARTFS